MSFKRCLTVLLILLSAGVLSAKVLQTRDLALAAHYPGAEFKRDTVFLTADQLKAIEQLAGTRPRSAVVHRYQAIKDGKILAVNYLDAHRVRTLPETLMISINGQNTVEHLQVLAFNEPLEYMPGRKWYAQFLKQKLGSELQLKKGIDGMTGATLTSRATTDAVRRALAIHQVLQKTP